MLNENLFRAARTENVAKRRFLLKQVVKDVLWGDSEIQEACNAGSSDWQTDGGPFGKYKHECLELQSTCRWSRCV